MRKHILLFTILLAGVQMFTACSHTCEETINCTVGTSGNLMNDMELFLVFGYNSDSTRQVCLALKMNPFEEGNYSTADSTFAAEYSFVAYCSEIDQKTTNLYNVTSGNFDVSINQAGDTIFSGKMSAINKEDSTDVDFTVTVPLKACE